MTRILSLLLVPAVAITIAACDTTGGMATGPAGAAYSMNVDGGRFHKVHVTDQGLACTTCHAGKEYRQDYVTLSKYVDDGGTSPGVVERTACLGCHKAGGTATAWYSGRATK